MITKFEEVAGQVADRVRRGVYSTAQRLPSEYDLAKEFDVSRLTVRKAIDLLIRQQVLVKDPGKGTYVMATPEKVESGRLGLQGFTEAAKAYGKVSRTEVLSFGPADHLPPVVTQALQLENRHDQRVDLLVRRRFWDDDPMTIEKIAICHEYVADRKASDFTGSLFDLIEREVPIAYSHQEIEAILVDSELADLLLRVNSVTYTADAKPIFYDTSYYRADKYSFKSTLTRQGH